MHFLILCIISSTGIFIIFKILDQSRIPPFPIIVINYFTATLLGFFLNGEQLDFRSIWQADWLALSIMIGVLFIVMFFLIAYSSRKAGISVTTVASKMSVIFPILFSLLIDTSDKLTVVKVAAIVCTLAGVAFTVYKPQKTVLDRAAILIPLVLFIGMGLVDSLVKFAQHRFVGDPDTAIFSGVLFLNAFLTGLLLLLFSPKYFKSFIKPSTWGYGVLLGAVNFGSIFFLVRALNHISGSGFRMDSSVIFGVNNTAIVGLSVLAGFWVFRERLRPMNWLGIVLSAIALTLFTYG